MSIVCNKRQITNNSCMLIHQLSGHMWGKFSEMQDDMKNSEMLMKKIKTSLKWTLLKFAHIHICITLFNNTGKST